MKVMINLIYIGVAVFLVYTIIESQKAETQIQPPVNDAPISHKTEEIMSVEDFVKIYGKGILV